eukprot:TRINITY_DN668_c0_g1_i1.p1 TRINITY_DN668_c0_g1~~TRINITY_DN668_c0_g1_i1.p1  ORF type:complete len:582 (-),score=118.63 TRINITY_DN668_c0_g1_i1:234-1979(-)
MIAIGTSQGKIILWDVKLGEVAFRLGDDKPPVHRSQINDVAFSNPASRLYACSDDKYISEWDTSTGKLLSKWKGDKHAITCLRVTDDGTRLLSASANIRLWDLSSKQVLVTFTGHASPVCSLDYRSDGKFFVSAAKTDRFVNVWPLNDGPYDAQDDVPEISAAQTFTMNDAPFQVRFGPGSKKKKFAIVGASATSVAIWQQPTKAPKTPMSPTTVLALPTHLNRAGDDSNADTALTANSKKDKRKKRKSSDTVYKGEVLGVHLATAKSALVVAGSAAVPVFVQQDIVDEDGDSVESATIAIQAKGALLGDSARDSAATKSAANKNNISVLGHADVKISQSSNLAMKNSALEPSLEETLRTMASLHGDDHPVASSPNEVSGGKGQQNGHVPTQGGARKRAPQADSLRNVLEQALQSGDQALLESCLSVTDRKIIENTVARLPSRLVIPFTQIIVDKFQSNPNRGVTLVVWIRAMLTHHTSYLLGVPHLVDSLQSLYQTMNSRLEVFRRLLKLSGRLDLVISHISRRQGGGGDGDKEGGDGAPLNIYREGEENESSGSEDEDSDNGDEMSVDDSDSEMDDESS